MKIHKRQPFSKETRKRMSKAKKGKPRSGNPKHWKHSEESKKKMSKSFKGLPHLKGEKSPAWRGGKSFEPYSVDWTQTLKRSIRERDKYICQKCGIHQDELNRKLDIHHIDYNKKNCDPDNLITLCQSCNSKVNHNRKYWTNYFQI